MGRPRPELHRLAGCVHLWGPSLAQAQHSATRLLCPVLKAFPSSGPSAPRLCGDAWRSVVEGLLLHAVVPGEAALQRGEPVPAGSAAASAPAGLGSAACSHPIASSAAAPGRPGSSRPAVLACAQLQTGGPRPATLPAAACLDSWRGRCGACRRPSRGSLELVSLTLPPPRSLQAGTRTGAQPGGPEQLSRCSVRAWAQRAQRGRAGSGQPARRWAGGWCSCAR